jgi:hypothetical protein
MGRNTLPKLVLTCYLIGTKKRKVGPKTTSMNGIYGVMGEMRLEEEERRIEEN